MCMDLAAMTPDQAAHLERLRNFVDEDEQELDLPPAADPDNDGLE